MEKYIDRVMRFRFQRSLWERSRDLMAWLFQKSKSKKADDIAPGSEPVEASGDKRYYLIKEKE